ncbi:MAG TPA: ABC transporter permease [Methanocorpusculum sp.]|nr:ABC transporter permease [Methanocorpusculum sp.]
MLSAVGIIIGIFAICSLGMAGAIFTDTIDNMIEENANMLMVSPYSSDKSVQQNSTVPTLSKGDLTRIESAVKRVTTDYEISPVAYVVKPVTANHDTVMSSTYLFGDKNNLDVIIGGYLKEGHMPHTDTDVIILTSTADKYNLKIGSHLKAETANGEIITLKVTGIIDDTIVSNIFAITLTPDIILAPDGLYSILNNDATNDVTTQNSILPNGIISTNYNTDTNMSVDIGFSLDYEIDGQSSSRVFSYSIPISLISSTGTLTLNTRDLVGDDVAEQLNLSDEYIIDTSELYAMLYPNSAGISYDYIMIRLNDPAARERVAASIEQEMNGNPRKIGDDRVIVQDLSALAGDLASVFSMAVLLGIGMSAIALIVASISIANVMIISVQERKHEIGVMRSIGTTRRQVTLIFLIEAAAIGVFGSIIGVVLSCIFVPILTVLLMQPITSILLPSVLMYIPLGILTGVVVCVISGLYPAIKASRLNPIEAMER